MDATHSTQTAGHADPLIDEVRTNRRALVAEFNNDLDRLADHLRQVQTEYESRTGAFATVPRTIDEELFPAMNQPIADPAMDEIRKIRAGIVTEQKL